MRDDGRTGDNTRYVTAPRRRAATRFCGGFVVRAVVLLSVLLSSLLGTAGSRPRKMVVPERNQMMIFLKVLTYDRTLMQDLTESVCIGVLYTPGNSASEANRDRIMEVLEEYKQKTINGRPLVFSAIAFRSPDQVGAALKEEEIRVLYVTEGHEDKLSIIANVTREHEVLTLTGVPDYVSKWLSVSLAVRGDTPRIVVNLAASRAERHEFKANLLRVCEVIR